MRFERLGPVLQCIYLETQTEMEVGGERVDEGKNRGQSLGVDGDAKVDEVTLDVVLTLDNDRRRRRQLLDRAFGEGTRVQIMDSRDGGEEARRKGRKNERGGETHWWSVERTTSCSQG